jgi:hypothetical protein
MSTVSGAPMVWVKKSRVTSWVNPARCVLHRLPIAIGEQTHQNLKRSSNALRELSTFGVVVSRSTVCAD